jgi:hypothetical protein
VHPNSQTSASPGHQAPEGTSPGVAAKAANGVSKEEQRLLDAVKQHDGASPKYRMDLAVFYLKNGKLDEAEATFKGIEEFADKQHPLNRPISRVGKAILLAYRDQAKESNDLFLSYLKLKTGGNSAYHPFWLQFHLLSEWVANALQRNYVNAPAAFPASLQPFRVPPAAKVKAAG